MANATVLEREDFDSSNRWLTNTTGRGIKTIFGHIPSKRRSKPQ
jgi:hypothetical protein